MTRNSLFALLVAFAALPACSYDGHNRVNGSVSVRSGETADKVSTVNGAIDIADHATAREAETVNGSIQLGAGAAADSLQTVNGGITLAEGAKVAHDVDTVNGAVTLARTATGAGSVDTVNGAITLRENAEVSGRLKNVNGRIQLTDAHVGGGLETVAGDLFVGTNSRVEGGILVKKPHGRSLKNKVPRVVIGPGAVVRGTLRFEREVKLYVSETATIGPVEGAEAERFSGSEPAG